MEGGSQASIEFFKRLSTAALDARGEKGKGDPRKPTRGADNRHRRLTREEATGKKKGEDLLVLKRGGEHGCERATLDKVLLRHLGRKVS